MCLVYCIETGLLEPIQQCTASFRLRVFQTLGNYQWSTTQKKKTHTHNLNFFLPIIDIFYTPISKSCIADVWPRKCWPHSANSHISHVTAHMSKIKKFSKITGKNPLVIFWHENPRKYFQIRNTLTTEERKLWTGILQIYIFYNEQVFKNEVTNQITPYLERKPRWPPSTTFYKEKRYVHFQPNIFIGCSFQITKYSRKGLPFWCE